MCDLIKRSDAIATIGVMYERCTTKDITDYRDLLLESVLAKDEPTTQTETQNSNLTFEKDECAKEYEELGLKELKELIKADRKTEPSNSEKPNNSTISKMEQVGKE